MERQTERNTLGRLYDRSLGHILPSDRLLAVLFCVLLNSVVYWSAQAITKEWHAMDLTTALDRMIPVVPAWAAVYVAAYPVWAAGYVLLARGGEWYTLMTAEVLAKLLCGLMFFVMPTTNVRPLLTGEPVSWLLALIYELDAPLCLFPSIHCLESWICCAGLRSRKELPSPVRWGFLAAAVLICLSTLFTKQHVLADLIAGVLLAEVLVDVSRRRGWGGRLGRMFVSLDSALLGARTETKTKA